MNPMLVGQIKRSTDFAVNIYSKLSLEAPRFCGHVNPASFKIP